MKSQVNGGILTDESTCKLINDCIALFQKDQIDTSLLSFIQMDMDRIDSISYRRIEFLSDEISIISRALFFYYSTFPVFCYHFLFIQIGYYFNYQSNS